MKRKAVTKAKVATKKMKEEAPVEHIGFTPQLALTSGWARDNRAENRREIIPIPENQIPSDIETPLQFNIAGLPHELIAPDIQLKLVLCVKRDDGTVEGATLDDEVDDVALVNNALSSLFKFCETLTNNESVTTPQFHHPWIAENRIFFNETNEYKKGFLRASGYFPDDGLYDASSANSGYVLRRKLIRKSKNCELLGPLYVDILNQAKPFPPKLGLKIRLYRNPDEFCLMAPESNTNKYKIVIKKAELQVRRIELQEVDIKALEGQLSHTTAKYPFISTEVKVFEVAKGSMNVDYVLIDGGSLPVRCCVLQVEQKSLLPDMTANPLKYLHLNLKQIYLECNGKTVPTVPPIYNFGGMDGRDDFLKREIMNLWAALYMNSYNDSVYGVKNAPLSSPPENFTSGNIRLMFSVPKIHGNEVILA